MRRPLLVVAVTIVFVLALAALAIAADPIIGTWKLNVAQSKISPVLQATWHWNAAKGRIEVYQEIAGDQIGFTENVIQTDGSPVSRKNTFPKKGGTLKSQEPLGGRSFVETLVDPGDWYVTGLQNDKQIELIHKSVSKDAKTMRQTIKGIDPKGRPYEGLLIYDRQ